MKIWNRVQLPPQCEKFVKSKLSVTLIAVLVFFKITPALLKQRETAGVSCTTSIAAAVRSSRIFDFRRPHLC